MKEQTRKETWWIWVGVTIAVIALLSYRLLESEDKSLFMPGPLTNGHHQIGLSCASCHKDPFGGGEVLQEACVDCHGDDRVKPFDSHPRAKFKDPRNADRLEHINALECISYHTEHQPDITLKNGLTQPRDFCFHCHSDIEKERPSHKGMAFDTCASSGCHNFHNNRALYTDFLVKHLGEPELLDRRVLPEREFANVLDEIADYPADRYPVTPLSAGQADAPAQHLADADIHRDWLETAHARSGVNCSACHLLPKAGSREESTWHNNPDHTVCEQCHSLEMQRFQRGKHGMRLAAGLGAMTPDQARLPMQEDAAHNELTCISCHSSHRFDVQTAAVDACLGCHADRHSLAFKGSPHDELWASELAGEAEAGSGVSCASCHMPRINFDVNEWTSRIMVEHNQNATLSPNSKMIRPACLHCHGLAFTIDALADEALIENNFRGKPSRHVESMDLAEADQRRALEETAALKAEE